MERRDNATKRRILRAALRQFADNGYSGASVQRIVDLAKVTKPTLYYYFRSKAGLYQALLDWAFNERYSLMQQAVKGKATLVERLTEILTALFEFSLGNRALMRIAFATAFASPGELPEKLDYLPKGQRNFDFLTSLISEAAERGELNEHFSADELAMGIQAMLSLHVMAYVVNPKLGLDRQKAERIVQLFMEGAHKQNRK